MLDGFTFVILQLFLANMVCVLESKNVTSSSRTYSLLSNSSSVDSFVALKMDGICKTIIFPFQRASFGMPMVCLTRTQWTCIVTLFQPHQLKGFVNVVVIRFSRKKPRLILSRKVRTEVWRHVVVRPFKFDFTAFIAVIWSYRLTGLDGNRRVRYKSTQRFGSAA